MNRAANGFHRLSLTQQVMLMILLMVGFLTCFFIFFLSGNISNIVSTQVYNMLASTQQPIVKALEDGKTPLSSPELFEYMVSDEDQNCYLFQNGKLIPLKDSQKELSQEKQTLIEESVEKLSKEKEPVPVTGMDRTAGTEVYYRLVPVKTGHKTVYLISFMNDYYASYMRSTLMDSTIYVTVLAFFLILLVFMLWVFSIIHPLNQIKLYISKIKEGKDVDLYINREDEIGDVAQELKTLTYELAKQEKAKEEMIHNISHDLKTPIATIKSYSESIKDGIYPYGDLESSVDVILDNASRLESKVHSLLYMNRVEYLVTSDAAGVVTNMKDVVEQVVLNSAVIRPEIELKTDVEEVFFDGLLESWRVCLENLMENAFRYAKTYIKIELKENDLRVYNDGPKMPEDRIDSLFKPYIKGEGGRFGLGLSIVSKVVAANGYRVAGMNTEDGVCFRIYRDVPNKKKRRNNSSRKNPGLTRNGNGSRKKNQKAVPKKEESGKESS